MREERRDGVVRSSSVANPSAGMSSRTSTKPYVIAKRAVWEAYQQVKANRGAAGIDEDSCMVTACRSSDQGSHPRKIAQWITRATARFEGAMGFGGVENHGAALGLIGLVWFSL